MRKMREDMQRLLGMIVDNVTMPTTFVGLGRALLHRYAFMASSPK